MTLYEVQNDLMEFQEMCSDPDAELDDQIVKDTMEAIQGDYDCKVEAWVKVIKNLSGELKAVKEEADRLTKRSRTIKNNIESMKKALITSMQITGRKTAGMLKLIVVTGNLYCKPFKVGIPKSKKSTYIFCNSYIYS